ncbi:MAG: hypothetical protein JNL67_02790 [Planctomycetaceae bacterium]|nr:hypothetical protein [Planctomycetaceae bacterium]
MKTMIGGCSVLLVGLALLGCEASPQTSANPTSKAKTGHSHAEGDADHDHDHGHSHDHAPHDGTLFDWGGGAYHVEFTVNHDTKEATVYVLGGDAKTPAPVQAEKLFLAINEPATELELSASPLEGEKDGLCSRFVGKHETLGIVRKFAGTVSGVVAGTPYTGDFKEEAHDHQH